MDKDFSSSAIVINNDGMGHGDESLRTRLLTNYLRTLAELGHTPRYILCYAQGVRMATTGSPCRGELDRLAEHGTKIVICRTCLEHYSLTDQVPEAEIGNMLGIVEAQSDSRQVITL